MLMKSETRDTVSRAFGPYIVTLLRDHAPIHPVLKDRLSRLERCSATFSSIGTGAGVLACSGQRRIFRGDLAAACLENGSHFFITVHDTKDIA